MILIVLAALVVIGVIAVILNEVRIAPEINEDYEVHLQERYSRRANRAGEATPKAKTPGKTDAA